MKTAKYIEVVRSNVKGLSSLSQISALAIAASLSKRYSNVTLTVIDTAEDLAALVGRKPDLVFLGMRYLLDPTRPLQKIWLNEELKQAGIPTTGSASLSHELELHKDRAKQRVLDHGLATARFFVITTNQPYAEQDIKLSFPLFVKPVSGGGGQGIDEYSVTRTPEQLRSKIASLRAEFATDVLVEEYLEGREFSVAITKDSASGSLIAMPIELIAPKDSNGESILSNKVKSLDLDRAIHVGNLEIRNIVMAFALDAFRSLGARDYGRIDIRLDRKGIPHFLEANLIPSLIDGYGSFSRAYKIDQGIEYDEMIATIVSLGLSRGSPVHSTEAKSPVLSLVK